MDFGYLKIKKVEKSGMNFRTKRFDCDLKVFTWNTMLIVFMITSHFTKVTGMKMKPPDFWESKVFQ